MTRTPLAALAGLLAALPASAIEVGESDYVFSSDLVERGFEPFAVTGVANATYGLTDGSDLYLCFIADTPDAQAERQAALIAELEGAPVAASVPNIPLICVMTQ